MNVSVFVLMRRLWAAGFEKRQAELIVSALVTLTTANMDVVYKDMVTKAHQVGRRRQPTCQVRAHLKAVSSLCCC